MKSIAKLTLGQFQSWKNDGKIWAAFMLSVAFSFMYAYRYISFVNLMRTEIQILEPYIIIGSSKHSFTGIFLGCILMLSDAPFLNERSDYEVLRVGTDKWMKSRVLYVAGAILLYNLAVIIETILLVLIAGAVKTNNGWSSAIVLLAEQSPNFAISNFKLAFEYPEFVHAVKPYFAACITLVFNCSYCFIIAMIILLANILSKRNIGWILAAVAHIFNYVISNNGFLVNIHISLLECATPAGQFSENTALNPYLSTWIFLILCVFFVYLSSRISLRMKI